MEWNLCSFIGARRRISHSSVLIHGEQTPFMNDVTAKLIAELKRIKGVAPIKRFLVVDDDESDCEFMRHVFGSKAIVETAKSSDKAIKKFGMDRCGGTCFTRVFLDMSFGTGMQGTDVIDHIRRVAPNTPITVVSGYYSVEMEQELKDMGYDIIDKTLPVDQFRKQLEKYL